MFFVVWKEKIRHNRVRPTSIIQYLKRNEYITTYAGTTLDGKSNGVKSFLGKDWEPYIKQDPRFMRPAEVDVLRGDYAKAELEMDWKPKTNFSELVSKMVDNDIKLLRDN